MERMHFYNLEIWKFNVVSKALLFFHFRIAWGRETGENDRPLKFMDSLFEVNYLVEFTYPGQWTRRCTNCYLREKGEIQKVCNGWAGGDQPRKFLWDESISCSVPASDDSEPEAWWNWYVPLRLSFDRCHNDADLCCREIWDLLMKSSCIVKKSEKERTLRQIIQELFYMKERFKPLLFSLLYVSKCCMFHFESLSLCVSHLSLGKKMQHQ